MKRGHAEILSIHELEHQRIINLVQSTDQRFQRVLADRQSAVAEALASTAVPQLEY